MNYVKKTSTSERVVHWLMVLSFFSLTGTGFAFAYTSLNWINLFFGGNHYAAVCHKWSGVLFIITVVISLKDYLVESLTYTSEDKQWLKTLGGYLDHKAEVPPQGRLNAGQKLFYLIIIVGGGLVISASGFMLWAGPSRIGLLLHDLAFFAMVSFMPVHIYLATAANPGVFRGMTRGTVSMRYARKHHAKWLRDQGLG